MESLVSSYVCFSDWYHGPAILTPGRKAEDWLRDGWRATRGPGPRTMRQNDEDMWLVKRDPVIHILPKLFFWKPEPFKFTWAVQFITFTHHQERHILESKKGQWELSVDTRTSPGKVFKILNSTSANPPSIRQSPLRQWMVKKSQHDSHVTRLHRLKNPLVMLHCFSVNLSIQSPYPKPLSQFNWSYCKIHNSDGARFYISRNQWGTLQVWVKKLRN